MTVDHVLTGTLFLAALALAAFLLWPHGIADRVVTPIVLFVAFEVTAVWFVFLPGISSVGLIPGQVAAVSLAAAVVAYLVGVGSRRFQVREQLFIIDGPGHARASDLVGSLRASLCIGALLVVFALVQFNGIPPLGSIVSALLDPSGGSETISEVREFRRMTTKSHHFGGEWQGQGILNSVIRVGWRHVLLLVFAASWLRPRGSSRLKWLNKGAVAIAITGSLFLAATGVRSSIVLLLLAIGIGYSLLHKIRLTRLLAYTVILLTVLLIISPLSKGERGGSTISERAAAMAERITTGNGENNAEIVRQIELDRLDMGEGQVLKERAYALLPGVATEVPFAHRLARLSGVAGDRSTGYSTATQYGLLYADFGFTGVVIGYGIAGVSLGYGSRLLVRRLRPLNPYRVALYSQVCLVLGHWAITGVTGVIASLGTLILLHSFAIMLGKSRLVSSLTPTRSPV